MLFYIFIILAVLCFVGCVLDIFDGEDVFGGLLAVFLLTAVVAGAILLCCRCNADAKEAAVLEERAALVYQLENNMYDNDNDIGKKELMNDILSFNKECARHQKSLDNFWFGIYHPKFWRDIEKIELG